MMGWSSAKGRGLIGVSQDFSKSREVGGYEERSLG